MLLRESEGDGYIVAATSPLGARVSGRSTSHEVARGMRIRGKRQRSEGSRERPEPGWHYVVVDSTGQILEIQVTVQASDKHLAHPYEQLRAAFHDTATHQDAPWRSGKQHRLQEQGQRVSHGLPHRAVGCNPVSRDTGTCGNRGPRGESLDAIAMEAANPGPAVALQPGDPYVAQLGVVTSKHRGSAHDQSNTNARTNGDVPVILHISRRAPASLGKRRAVYVGVDCDRNCAMGSQPADDIGA